EDSAFFASHRIAEAKKAVGKLAPGCGLERAIDFGCGVGNASESLKEIFGFRAVLGLDVSATSLTIANARFDNPALEFETIDCYTPSHDVDLVYCNGVFHHIAPELRKDSVAYIHDSLKPGGIFVFWENNPWNPGVHYVM